jgi:hypothetical protein
LVLKRRQDATDDWANAPSSGDPDPWFNPYRLPATERARAVVHEVESDLSIHESRERARRASDQLSMRNALTAVVTNLIHHHLSGGQGKGLPVPRAKHELGKHNRYQPPIFHRTFPKLLDQLKTLGYLRQRKGSYSGFRTKSRRTTIKAGKKLVDLVAKHGVSFEDLRVSEEEEIIVLKRSKRSYWDVGERIDYQDTDITRGLRAQLIAINAWLEQADITFDQSVSDKPVDVSARRLYRYFTQSSFESGGRHFGGFWQFIRKDIRWKGLTIEGEPVVGLDYAQFNPILAYSIVGARPPTGDAYTLPGLESHREGVKKVFNALLFDQDERTKFPKGTNVMFPKGTKVGDVIASIKHKHPALTSVLSTGIGHRLMFHESELMTRVLQHLQHLHIVGLPVFDAVLVKASKAHSAQKVMRGEFLRMTGIETTVQFVGPLARSLSNSRGIVALSNGATRTARAT